VDEATVFADALEKSPAERASFLAEVCGNNPGLRSRVEDLLRAYEEAGSFLEMPAAEGSPREATLAPGADRREANPEDAARTPDRRGNPGEADLDFLGTCRNPGRIGRLGRYEVTEVLGRGGFGIVLRAFDPRLTRVVAIKVLAPVLAASVVARRRFLREAQAAAAVSHDHVVTIHEVDEANKPPYIVMECVVGQSLQQKLETEGPLEVREILRIGMQTASALAAAHAQGLIHRDIKPANILLENGIQRVKITDFGLARAADDVSLTRSGVIAGTPQYMSPEQAQGETLDCRSDLFSLGSVLYAACTGSAPFLGNTAIAVLRQVVEDTPRPIREVNPDVPDWLAEIVGTLMAKDRGDRFASAAEVADLLGQHLARLQHPPPSTGRPQLASGTTAHRGLLPSPRRPDLPDAGSAILGHDAIRRRFSLVLCVLGILWSGAELTLIHLQKTRNPGWRLKESVLAWCAGGIFIGLVLLAVSRPAGRWFGWAAVTFSVLLTAWFVFVPPRVPEDDVWRILVFFCTLAPALAVEGIASEAARAPGRWRFRCGTAIPPLALVVAALFVGYTLSPYLIPVGLLLNTLAMVAGAACVVRWYSRPAGWATLLAFPLFYLPILAVEKGPVEVKPHPALFAAISGAYLVLALVLAWRVSPASPGTPGAGASAERPVNFNP
jgi:serine/threonine protein kinase